MLQGELANEGSYQKISLGDLRLGLPELQAEDQEAQKKRQQGLKDGWENIDEVLHNQSLLYVLEVIQTELISHHHDDPLTSHFGIDKTQELIAKKYYWSTLRYNVKSYV